VGYVEEIATFDDGWITATDSSATGAREERVSEARPGPLRDSTASRERR
jgi:hypothetical protein